MADEYQPTAEEQAASEEASALFYAAMIALGAKATQDALATWGDVPSAPNVSGTRAAAQWVKAATASVMQNRLKARDLALAYYRYQRALETGTTVPNTGNDDGATAESLSDLRQAFEDQVGADLHEEPPDKEIPVEDIGDYEDELEQLEDDKEEQVADNLANLGPKLQDKKTEAGMDPQQAHDEAGRRQAASASRNAMDGARGPLYLAGGKDAKIIGYVRVSSTGTPCGFCAMLISRGPVFYKSDTTYRRDGDSRSGDEQSVGAYGDVDRYHDNCKCYSVPIYSMDQYNRDPRFDQNRELNLLWPKVTKGLGGEDAIAEWRRYMRNHAKQQVSQEDAALAA